jgi:hypothetical protein
MRSAPKFPENEEQPAALSDEEWDEMVDMESDDEEIEEAPLHPRCSCCQASNGPPIEQRWKCPSLPSNLPENVPHGPDDRAIMVSVDYATGNINNTEEVCEMNVALDSGAVDHVLATDDLPSSAEICELTGSRVGKSFVAANGQPMQTFGECTLECEDERGLRTAASFAVTEVSRPLQSVSRICDQDLEVLFTKTEAKIRDPKSGRFVATYPRRGGLYTRTVKVRAGKKPDQAGRPRPPFTRPSPKR